MLKKMRKTLFILIPFVVTNVGHYIHYAGVLSLFLAQVPESKARENLNFLNEWSRLLHFENRNREVVSNEFYLAEGRDVKSEKDAFLEALNSKEGAQLACNFPARYKLFQKYFPNTRKINLNNCLELNKFLSTLSGSKISFGLASEYFKAPSSSFGHLMLVIHEDSKPNLYSSVIHYAAKTNPKDGFFSYSMKGLTGGYYGYYLKTNLFDKLNEYSKIEQRFVHYYTLDLSAEKLEFLKFVL